MNVRDVAMNRGEGDVISVTSIAMSEAKRLP